MGDDALLPLMLLTRRTQIGTSLVGFFTRMAFFVAIYYLPLFFQAVKGHSATKAGIDLVPLVLSVVITGGIGGILVSRTGRFWYFLAFGPLFGAVAFGLLYTISETTSWAKLIGYQILIGISIGTTLQNAILAAQSDVPKRLAAQASALVMFTQFVGAIVGIAIVGTIFQNKLASGLKAFAPDAPYEAIRQSVEVLKILPPSQKAGAIHAYVEALKLAFITVGVTASVLCSVSAILVENFDLTNHPIDEADFQSRRSRGKRTSEKSEERV
jgi:MFS family permease